MDIIKELDPLSKFMVALRAPDIKRQWPPRLKIVFDYLNLDGGLHEQARQFVMIARENPQWVTDSMLRFVSYQLERVSNHEISKSTVPNYTSAAKLFFDMNDLELNWKKITRVLPKRSNAANDRAPSLEEIRRLIEYPDRRIKAIVCTMVSSGIRLGAWDYLRWKHVIPMKNDKNNEVVCAKLVVYAGDDEEYCAFITLEAYNYLKEWIDFRASHGEEISGDSWLMRDLWQTTNVG